MLYDFKFQVYNEVHASMVTDIIHSVSYETMISHQDYNKLLSPFSISLFVSSRSEQIIPQK